jgi:chromosome segregation ATPase
MGGAARFAHMALAADPVAYQLEVGRVQHERQIKELKDKFAVELAEVRRVLTAEIVEVRRDLIASRAEVEHFRAANADLQCHLQEQDAELKNVKSVNADLEQKLRAFDNISKFMAEFARGEMRGER